MIDPSLYKYRKKQAGMAYVVLLALLAIMTTLGLAFAFKVGIETSATETRSDGMQAQYLAEAAANHAMWRLLSETTTAFQRQVSHDDDDGEEEFDGSMDIGANKVEMGSRRYGGARFLNISIPQGATITNAYIRFKSEHTHSEHTDLTIRGDDRDDAARFTPANGNISSRPQTTAAITWNDIPAWTLDEFYRTPDLSAIIQEIVDRPGWTSGNAMAILFESTDSGGKRCFTSHDNSPADTAILYVHYADASVAAGGKYYMHSLAGGRYGYKIRRHTDTTFATIATVGAVGENVVNQSYVLYIKPNTNELLCEGLVGYWRLNESSGSASAWDASGNGNHGALEDMDPSTDWVSGHLDGALDFDGVDDHIDISVMNPRDYDDFTFSAWYRSADTSVSDDEYIFYHGFNYEDEIVFGPTDDQPDRLRLGININNSWNAYYGTSDIVDQQWHHLVAVRGGGRVKIYVDGVEETNDWDSDSGQTASIDGDGPFIGNYPGITEQVHGVLDEVRVYNRALEPEDVALLYALTKGGCGSLGNNPPFVDAGPDQSLQGPAVKTILDGMVADDGLPDPPKAVTTTWSQVSGPGTVIFGDASAINTGAVIPEPGVYTLRLTADDGELENFDEVTITLKDLKYVEKHETWAATDDDSWIVVDLSASPYNVPANAVIEVAITNSRTGNERWGGVRAVGSALERRFQLHEAEAGGVDAVVMHVQADGNSEIEYYADTTSDIGFILIGYWRQGTYIETFDDFQASNDQQWESYDLDTYGVGAGQVVEFVIANTKDKESYSAGVRKLGSSLNRILDPHEAESGGVDTSSMFVQASNDANATVEIYSEKHKEVDFYIVGYWSTPPGTYTEAQDALGSASSDQTWEDLDLTSFGVPADAIVQIAMANESGSSENRIGLRLKGSSQERVLDLQEAESGGNDLATMHVNADVSSTIECYHEDVSDGHQFYLMGWWE